MYSALPYALAQVLEHNDWTNCAASQTRVAIVVFLLCNDYGYKAHDVFK
jgi:hypothetical protein